MDEPGERWRYGGQIVDVLPADAAGRMRLVIRKTGRLIGFVRGERVVFIIDCEGDHGPTPSQK